MKRLLTEMGAQFELRDVRRDPAALAEFQRLGALLPPITVVGDQVVVGYQPELLERLILDSADD